MGLRLILVGVVAGLGLSLPSRQQIEVWRGSAQGWVCARFAERDARMPVDENAFVLIAEPAASEDSAPPIAAAHLPASLASAESKTTLPVTEAPQTAIDTSPAELARGLDAPTPPTDENAPEIASAAILIVSDASFDAAQAALITAFTLDVQASKTVDVAASRPTVVENQVPAVDETDLDFTKAQAAFITSFVSDEQERLLASSSEELKKESNREVRELKCFEPLFVSDFLYEGVAYALNKDAEGLNPQNPLGPPAATISFEVRSSPQVGSLTQAVRLTREAVHAWANLLHGPAVVTLAH